MTRDEFKQAILRYKKFYGQEKFLTDPAEYELWYQVFKNKSFVVFDYAAMCFTRRKKNLAKMPDLNRMIKEYNIAREKEVGRMEDIRQFFLESQAIYPKHLLTDEDEDTFWYLVQTEDWDMCYRRAEFLRDATRAYVTRLTNLGRVAKWKTLADQFIRTVERYNEGIPRRELGPEEDDDSERYSRASYYWGLINKPKLP